MNHPRQLYMANILTYSQTLRMPISPKVKQMQAFSLFLNYFLIFNPYSSSPGSQQDIMLNICYWFSGYSWFSESILYYIFALLYLAINPAKQWDRSHDGGLCELGGYFFYQLTQNIPEFWVQIELALYFCFFQEDHKGIILLRFESLLIFIYVVQIEVKIYFIVQIGYFREYLLYFLPSCRKFRVNDIHTFIDSSVFLYHLILNLAWGVLKYLQLDVLGRGRKVKYHGWYSKLASFLFQLSGKGSYL